MQTSKCRKSAGTLLAGALCLASLIMPTHACELAIVWKADLTGSTAMPSAATGTAAIQFDFAHPEATVQVDTKNLRDACAIDLHVSRSYSDHAGPTVIRLYTPTDGPLPTAFTKRVTETDLRKQISPKIASFSDLVQAVLNHRAYVTVTTKDHPEGELSGFITMHKEAVYSDNPADASHDAALHHAARNIPVTLPRP